MNDKELLTQFYDSIRSELLKIPNDCIKQINIWEALDAFDKFIEEYIDFRQVVEQTPLSFYISDKDGRTLFVNNAYTKTTGIKRDQVVGKLVSDLTDLFQDPIVPKVLESKKQINSNAKILVNGRPLILSGTPIFDNTGELMYVASNDFDIEYVLNMNKEYAELKAKKEKDDAELIYLRNKRLKHNEEEPVFASSSMKEVVCQVEQIAPTDATVLISGESGTGKEVIANMIYIQSDRNEHPFIDINCASIPSSLMESELFGYISGAFTGADKKGKPGLFELANHGTVFLDEISEIPLDLQAKLLRVLQERKVRRIGGADTIDLDIRIIAATNRDLYKEVEKGKFREDLFYRLNVIPIHIPPLRERLEDIKVLAISFLNQFNQQYRKNIILEDNSLSYLKEYSWPGNIRELKNMIERLVIVNSGGSIDISILTNILNISNKDHVNVASNGKHVEIFVDKNPGNDPLHEIDNSVGEFKPLKSFMQDTEKEYIKKAIKSTGGNVAKAAKKLHINRSAIYRKLGEIDRE